MTAFRHSIKHPKLVRLYDYWDFIRDNRAMPARLDLDPLDIPALLANILLLDVEYEPVRFRIRLYGTACATIRGKDITGHYMEEPGISRIGDLTYPANEEVVETKAPHFMTAPYPLESGSSGIFYRLGLPMSEDGQRVSMIITGFYQEQRALSAPREKASIA